MPRVTKASPAAEPVDELAESAWRQRAVDRSTQAARNRAVKRVQRFINAAREIIDERGTTEFTVQEVVERSEQSLRSFYQYFGGKHELLLGLFEEEILESVDKLRAASAEGDPIDRLEATVTMLYELSRPGHAAVPPTMQDFASQLMVKHPEAVNQAYAPIFEHVAGVVQDAADAGLLRPGRPRRLATMVMQAATVTAGRVGGLQHDGRGRPITADEVWEFCLHGIVTDDVLARRR